MDEKRACGGCGTGITEKNEREEYNSLCSSCPVPHMSMTNLRTPDRRFRCSYCGQEDQYDNLMNTNCGHVYTEKCGSCGGIPFCDKDCALMSALISNPTVVAGFQKTH